MDSRFIRNFAIISHIDHGKSTLADRLMELTGLIPPLPSGERKAPRIDRMELEIERGVTIKLKAVRLPYSEQSEEEGSRALARGSYTLNMIDTPGHVDFSYEVSRSLAACEGALLLVDATQGSQAQTVAHLDKAHKLGLAVIGVINKIDSPLARVEEVEEEMRSLGITGEILKISALEGRGIEWVLEAVIGRIPPPKGNLESPLRALVFDSTYDEHLGVVAYVRVVDGVLKAGGRGQKEKIRFIGTGAEALAKEIGFFTPDRKTTTQLSAGEVGYVATGLKDPQAVRAGDTVACLAELAGGESRRVQLSGGLVVRLPGYKEPQSFVFASFFPAAGDFSELRQALGRLRLEEPAISAEEIASSAFGRGFKLGFLGTFHLEIVKERLEREFGLELIVTKPTVEFKGIGGNKGQQGRQGTQEPWIRVTIITPPEHLSGVIRLVENSRGGVGETQEFGHRLRVAAELPLMEFVKGFYDHLKSLSSGYASLDWEFIGYRSADLVKLDIAVHDEVVEGLSEIVLRDQAQNIGREKVKKLKEVMPRQQFAYALQAKIGGKVVAREDVPAVGKDVLAKLSGGHVERKMKKLQQQRKGKKKLARLGRVEVPPKAFLF